MSSVRLHSVPPFARAGQGSGPAHTIVALSHRDHTAYEIDPVKLYVMNSGAGDVCVIDLKEMKVAARRFWKTLPSASA